jgi:FkbM family methyltransferase
MRTVVSVREARLPGVACRGALTGQSMMHPMIDSGLQHCVVDVGANHGEFSIEVARRNPGVRVVAIEPIPQLAEGLRLAASAFGLANLSVVEAAISRSEGTASMNISDCGDSGVSSLLAFDERAIAKNEYWVSRSDLQFDRVVAVQVTQLSTVLSALGIDVIDFIKLDTQGLDLEILQSVRESGIRVRAGMLEAPSTMGARLYEDEPLLIDVLNYLTSEQLTIHAVKPNDPACAEVNVFFCSPDEDWEALESKFGLRGVQIFDGKNYWYDNSSIAPHRREFLDASRARLERLLLSEQAAWGLVAEMRMERRALGSTLSSLRSDLLGAQLPLMRQAENAKVERDAVAREIGLIMDSASWRLTRPVRAIAAFVRSVRQGR